MITHIVVFKLKDPSPENINATRDRIAAIEGQIPQIRSMQVGINVVQSPVAYDLALLMTFDSVDDLRAFQKHPVHQAMLQEVMPRYADFKAVDFET